MSLWTAKLSFLSSKPRVWEEEGRLCARTGAFKRFLLLYSCDRGLTVDPATRMIEIRSKRFWFFRNTRVIPFERVHYIDYEFEGTPTAWNHRYGTTNQVETFAVSLVLREPKEKVTLFRFEGEGASMTGLDGVLFGEDSLIDLEGDQMETSKEFVCALKDVLKVPIGEPFRMGVDAAGNRYACAYCGRPSPPKRTKCQYCGGQVVCEAGPPGDGG